MERLSGLDASFLYVETPTLHMHTLKIGVIDPSTVPGGYTFERVREELATRLHLLPPFRRRLVEVPLGLHHPVWIEDPDFDLGWHVRRIGCPPPGGSREFDQVVSDIASVQLDRSRPLWEIWVVEGLEGGRVGFVAKIHHALADGVAAAALLANVMTLSPEDIEPPPPTTPWVPEEVPSQTRLVADALRSIGRLLVALPALLGRTARGVGAVVRRRRTAAVSPPLPFSTPRTSFNTHLTRRRIFATTTLSLSDVRAVKDALGVTVNDVVLALSASSLRAYLDRRGQLPDRPLVAGVPVATGSLDRLSGNKVSNMFTALRTDLADPIERLHAIHEVTTAAKEVNNLLGADMLADWNEWTPPRLYAWFWRQYSKRGLASRHRPPINLVVSNVPGPRDPLYVAGGKLVALYSVGPILEGIGLNITVWSYLDQLNVSAIACPERVPDLHEVVEGFHDALAELQKAAAG